MRNLVFLIALVLVCAPAALAGHLELTLDAPDCVVAPDFTEVDFYGTLSYIYDGYDQYDYQRQVSWGGSLPSGLLRQDGDYPATIQPGQSYTGLLFSFVPDPAETITSGCYEGTVQFTGSVQLGTYFWHRIHTEPLDFSVTVVPEPSSLAGLAVGILPFAGLAIRRRG